MDATDFESERPRLAAIATRILGSRADADDVLQEAQLRLTRTDDIDDLPAWLTTVVTRLCLDHLRKRTTRAHFEAHAPDDFVPVDPEADALLAQRVGDAMEVVLDTLAPAERAAFVLHDVFGYAFVFHVADGLVREVELIADPEVLATMDITRVRSDRNNDN